MQELNNEVSNLITTAKELHSNEKKITIQSILLIGELESINAAANLRMNSEQFIRHIGLTPNKYWKRAQAARVIRDFPQALEMLKNDETLVSHLALISPKITVANSKILLQKIKNRSTREVRGILSRITPDGALLDKEPELELRITLTESQMTKIDRAREVLSHSGHMPGLVEIFMKAVDDLLEKRDPMRRAERAEARKKKINFPSSEKELTNPTSEEKERNLPSTEKGKKTLRPPVPAEVRHAVWLRDKGQCTWHNKDGNRCPEKAMLELDHIKMWCRGGRHEIENLTLRCRNHNQFLAAKELGLASP